MGFNAAMNKRSFWKKVFIFLTITLMQGSTCKTKLFPRHNELHLLLIYIVHHNARIYLHMRFIVFSCHVYTFLCTYGNEIQQPLSIFISIIYIDMSFLCCLSFHWCTLIRWFHIIQNNFFLIYFSYCQCLTIQRHVEHFTYIL